nr:putative integron gene cassette protein [uncultured bacterium]
MNSGVRPHAYDIAASCFSSCCMRSLSRCWGLGTVAGRHAFDEMAGILPLASGAISVLLALFALLAWWRHARLRMVKSIQTEA